MSTRRSLDVCVACPMRFLSTHDVLAEILAGSADGGRSRLAFAHTERVLSPREADVLAHLARGLSNKEIARSIGVSDATVKNHLSAIYRKLDVRSRSGAIAVAIYHGYLTPT